MKAVFKWTIWQRRWSIFWWSLAVFGLIFITLIFYPSFKDQAGELQKTFENLPDTAVQLFGGSTDFFSPVGFLNSQIFFFMLPLLLGILAISLGSNLLAREEQDRTIEALLARPLSRTKFLTAKSLAGIFIISFVTAISIVTTVITSRVVNLAVPTKNIVLTTLACYLLSLSFGAVAFMFTAIGRARGASLGIATLIAIGGYLISSLSGTVDWLKVPSKIFPFDYYKSEQILRGTYNWENLIFFIVVIILCAGASWLSFRRRDIS